MSIIQKPHFILIGLLAVLVSGCSSVKTQAPFYAMAEISQSDLLSGKSLFGKKAGKITLPDDHVMDISEDMSNYLDKYIRRNSTENLRVKSLMNMLLGQGLLAMEYNAAQTLTAREAFRRSEGNCLAFSFLYAALGRKSGLKLHFQEVMIPPQWDEISGDLYYVSRHVNIRVSMEDIRDYVLDIDRVNYKPYYRTVKISDQHAIALYYSNKGTDFLYDGDVENAFRYLVKALRLAPKDAALWSNLGVLYRLQGQYSYAEKAYFIALRHDGRQQSVLGNLSALYEQIGEMEKSEYYLQLAKARQMKNPYYRYYQAVEAFEEGNYDLTLDHLQYALKRRDDVYKFYDLLGETYAKFGWLDKANKAWEKARQIKFLQ